MATIASLNVYLNAQTEGFSKGVEAATRETVRFMMHLDQQARTIGMTADEAKLYNLEMRGVDATLIKTARETLAHVNPPKAQHEASNKVNDSMKSLGQILKGGGVLAGGTIIMNQLATATHKVADAVEKGATGWRAMTYEITKSLPIAGQTIEVMENIRMAWTSEAAAIKKAEEATKKYTAVAEGLNALLEKRNDMINQLAKMRQDNADAKAIDGASGLEKELLKISHAARDAKAELNAMFDKAAKDAAKMAETFADVPQVGDFMKHNARMLEHLRKAMLEEQRIATEREAGKAIVSSGMSVVGGFLGNLRKQAINVAKSINSTYYEGVEKNLKSQLEGIEAARKAMPDSMQFATANLATASNMGIGEAFRNAMSIDFGNDRAKVLEKLNKEQLEIQRKIEENTRRQGALSNANFN